MSVSPDDFVIGTAAGRDGAAAGLPAEWRAVEEDGIGPGVTAYWRPTPSELELLKSGVPLQIKVACPVAGPLVALTLCGGKYGTLDLEKLATLGTSIAEALG